MHICILDIDLCNNVHRYAHNVYKTIHVLFFSLP